MSVAVVIPTVDRPDALRRALEAVHSQTLPADLVVVCPPDAGLLPADVRDDPRITVVDGVRGLTAQRNHAVAAVPAGIDYVTFFDDDAVPRSDYLEQAVALLDAHPDVVGLSGRVARDGADERVELTSEEMLKALDESRLDTDATVQPVRGLYGCNMVIRAEAVRELGFDERLPLYGWLEDLDFSRRALSKGALVLANAVVCVHQGSNSGGRRQHRRLGYSQVTNIAYLYRKGSIKSRDLPNLLARPVLKTVKATVFGPQRSERLQRLGGMALATGDLLRGRVTPERIVDL